MKFLSVVKHGRNGFLAMKMVFGTVTIRCFLDFIENEILMFES